jgi:hypothetical protein
MELTAEAAPRRMPRSWLRKPRQPLPPPDADTTDAARQLRRAMRRAIGTRTIVQAAGLACCSTNTLARILRGDNVTIGTLVRIASRLGSQISIEAKRKLQT